MKRACKSVTHKMMIICEFNTTLVLKIKILSYENKGEY
jgi:hypothetical protein